MFSSFVFFATFVVEFSSLLWLRLCRAVCFVVTQDHSLFFLFGYDFVSIPTRLGRQQARTATQ
jgi:hypothetical protein